MTVYNMVVVFPQGENVNEVIIWFHRAMRYNFLRSRFRSTNDLDRQIRI